MSACTASLALPAWLAQDRALAGRWAKVSVPPSRTEWSEEVLCARPLCRDLTFFSTSLRTSPRRLSKRQQSGHALTAVCKDAVFRNGNLQATLLRSVEVQSCALGRQQIRRPDLIVVLAGVSLKLVQESVCFCCGSLLEVT